MEIPTTFKLPMSNKTVEFDNVQNADGHLLMRARMLADERVSPGVHILAALCKIDGEKVTADDILDLELEDVVALEDYYLTLKKNLSLIRKK
ncbi:hypothetical protein IJ732_04190 [bacterium]|nr:hypothetical protein [bacterium]